MQTCTSLLHDGARDHVLEGFLQLAEGAQALLGNGRAPLIHHLLLVDVAADDGVYGLLDDFAHVVDFELVLVVIHFRRILTLF